jgi:methionine-S-sulfoxide reductase
MQSAYKLATLGGGCFWCLDGVFTRVKGVIKVESGFSGDVPANANYKQVCSGTTKHAEVVQIQFDELVVTFVELLTIFFGVHDPTTLNKYRFLYNYR